MAIIVVGLVVAIAAGFGAGWGLKPDASVKAIQAQTQSIEALQAGQKEILAEAQKPVLLDAAIRATLTEIPPQCVAVTQCPRSVHGPTAFARVRATLSDVRTFSSRLPCWTPSRRTMPRRLRKSRSKSSLRR